MFILKPFETLETTFLALDRIEIRTIYSYLRLYHNSRVTLGRVEAGKFQCRRRHRQNGDQRHRNDYLHRRCVENAPGHVRRFDELISI